MALWDGTTLNNTRVASLANQYWEVKGVPMVARKNGFLYAVLGKTEITRVGNVLSLKSNKISRLITGDKIEKKLLGKVGGPSKVANGSAELAAATASYATDAYGAATWALTHYSEKVGIPTSEYLQIRGDELKTTSYLEDKFLEINLGVEKALGTDLAATNGADPVAASVGSSWVYAIQGVDGLWTNGSDDYGTISRDVAGNADFRGLVRASTGALTTGKLMQDKIDAGVNGGTIDIGVCGAGVYGVIHQLVGPMSFATYNEGEAKFGSENVGYAGIRYLLDGYCPSGYLGHIDSSTFGVWMKQIGLLTEGIVRDPGAVTGYCLPYDIFFGCYCFKPNGNVCRSGITF